MSIDQGKLKAYSFTHLIFEKYFNNRKNNIENDWIVICVNCF